MNTSTIDEDFSNLHLLADTCIEQGLKDISLENSTCPVVLPCLPFSIPKSKRSSINTHSAKSATTLEVDHGKRKSSSTGNFNENNNNTMMRIMNVEEDDQQCPYPPPELSREFCNRIEKLDGFESDVSSVNQNSSTSSSNSINEKKKMKMNAWQDQHGPNPPPELSREFIDQIENMGGTDVRLVIQKQLYETDLKIGNNKLSMPCRQLRTEFLNEKEKMVLNTIEENGVNLMGIQVSVIEPCLEVTNLCLKKCDFKCSNRALVLIKNWNNVVQKNGLQVHDVVQVWSFRVGSILHFAIVKLKPDDLNNQYQ